MAVRRAVCHGQCLYGATATANRRLPPLRRLCPEGESLRNCSHLRFAPYAQPCMVPTRMCGIFGVAFAAHSPTFDADFAKRLLLALLRNSETRGKEAAGLAVHTGSQIDVLKQAGSVADFISQARFQAVVDGALRKHVDDPSTPLALLGHSRLVTNGTQANADNNQPVITNGAVALHNGIIVNDTALAEQHPELQRRAEVDTEVLAALVRTRAVASGNLPEAVRTTFNEIEGSASLAMIFDDLAAMLLATNTGSLFTLSAPGLLAFASERFILQRTLADKSVRSKFGEHTEVVPVHAGSGLLVGLHSLEVTPLSLQLADAPRVTTSTPEPRRSATATGTAANPAAATHHAVAEGSGPNRAFTGGTPDAPSPAPQIARFAQAAKIIDHSPRLDNVRRCKRCILPETYPYVGFDGEGVCRWCRTWKTIVPKGEAALREHVAKYRRDDGKPDCIVAFSGGRDSSWGLHYVKKTLGMNPVAFTYDWGMVTDLARRNQARICGKLGVEHIVRSADITAKRRYVRKNVQAWLKKPELGMVTLFMAGDKEFYQHARQLRKETGIKLVIFCTGNMIEDAPYKVGLCGIEQDDHGNTLTGMSLRNRVGLLWYYARNYLTNPSYINESLLDTLNAFYQTFVVKDDFLYLFHYLPWHEDEIVGTIRREYDWEVATDTTTTWRIGDGTAPFYNYIYHTVAGFTEDEVMLSNMVREGHLSRETALARAIEYAKPRWPSIREYAQLIGFSTDEALQIINAIPKRY